MMQKLLIIGLFGVWPALAQAERQPPVQAQAAALDQILQGEDRRDAAVILEAMQDGAQRRRGIRALGRLEQPDLIRYVAPALGDGVGVRAEAANALAQLAVTPEAVVEVERLLIERATADANIGTWEVWGEIAAALGRLRFTTAAQVEQAEAVLIQGLPAPDSFNDVDSAALVGAVRGLETLARTVRVRRLGTLGARTWDLIRWAATSQRPVADPRSAITRRLAMSALVTGAEATPSIIDRALNDRDAEVRRLAAQAAGLDGALDGREALLARALADADAHVRWEGLRSWGRQLQKTSCAPVRAALADADPHVALQAIDLLGDGCPGGVGVTDLEALVDAPMVQPRAWHRPAHALVALAKVSPGQGQTALTRLAVHQIWQVRMYAARAAATLEADNVLSTLAHDPVDNVREAALAGLIAAHRPEAVPLAIEALNRPDYQLIITASKAFTDPSVAGRAAPPLVTALGRITSEHKDTSRDPRLAILETLEALDTRDQARNLERYLRDFDRRVAEKAAELLQHWTGTPRTPAPQPLAAPGVTVSMVDALRGKSLRFHMAGGGSFDVELDVEAAPLSAVRIARRAGEGYYNGLTFHRVAPNFVIQGGSPGANEYSGDALYMRDEPGLHPRGTVGVSTRGRDTGDAQIFVNLVDSPRLDHIYTVLGRISAGLDIVDGVLEGDVIERVELVGR